MMCASMECFIPRFFLEEVLTSTIVKNPSSADGFLFLAFFVQVYKIHLISQGPVLCDKMDMYYNNSVNIYKKVEGSF